MPPEAVIYPKLKKIDAELKQQNRIIFDVEHIVRRYGFANVQEFYNTFRTSEDAYRRYQKDCSEWEGKILTEKMQSRRKKVFLRSYSVIKSMCQNRTIHTQAVTGTEGRDSSSLIYHLSALQIFYQFISIFIAMFVQILTMSHIFNFHINQIRKMLF